MKCSRPYSCHRCSTRPPLTGKRMPSQYLLWLIAAVTLNDATGVVSANSAPPTPMLVYVNHTLVNFANGTTPGSAGNKYGYEDGSVRRVGNTTHLFVSELIGERRTARTTSPLQHHHPTTTPPPAAACTCVQTRAFKPHPSLSTTTARTFGRLRMLPNPRVQTTMVVLLPFLN